MSHTRLQLPRLELLVEPATVSCLTRILAQLPERTATPSLPGKRKCISQYHSVSVHNGHKYSRISLTVAQQNHIRFGSPAEQRAQVGRSSLQLLAEGLLLRLQYGGGGPAAATEAVACVLRTEAVGVVLNRPAADGRWEIVMRYLHQLLVT